MLPLLGEILFKIFFVGAALFFLDARIALVTILLLATPLYVPKLIEKRLQQAQPDRALRTFQRDIQFRNVTFAYGQRPPILRHFDLTMENGTNFSGGEKKRICLARALLRDTSILILDEPLANLDSGSAECIEDLLLSIRDKALLIVSHQFSGEKLGMFDLVLDLTQA